MLRLPDLEAHYTDAGVLPREVLHSTIGDWLFAVHSLSGAYQFQLLLFFVAGVCAMLLSLGIATRVALLISWLLLASLHSRNPLVLNAGDVLLRQMLFWSMFLPFHNPRPAAGMDQHVLSPATVAIVAQIALCYWVSAIVKSSAVWWQHASAFSYAAQLDYIALPAARALAAHGWLAKMLTRCAYLLELCGPCFIGCPIWSGPIRAGVVCAFLFFHACMIFLFDLGLFPYICMVCWILLLPDWAWVKLCHVIPTRARDRLLRTASWFQARRRIGIRRRLVFPAGLGDIGALAGLVLLLIANYVNVRRDARELLPHSVTHLITALRLDQEWNMFAPFPALDDGWFLVQATLRDGVCVNVLDPMQSPTDAKPPIVARSYRSVRWKRYLYNLYRSRDPRLLAALGTYACKQGTPRSGKEPTDPLHVELIFMLERTPRLGKSAETYRIPLLLAPCVCKPETSD